MSDEKYPPQYAQAQASGAYHQAAYAQNLAGLQGMQAQVVGPAFDLSFGQAIAALKRGQRVSRRGWNGKGMFLELQRPCEHSKMRQPYIFIRPVGGEPVPWVASQPDMLEEDWGVVI